MGKTWLWEPSHYQRKRQRDRERERRQKKSRSADVCFFFSSLNMTSACMQVLFHRPSDNPNVCHSLYTPGAAAAGWQTADWPATAALPAPFHKVLHQTAGGENQKQAESAEGQPRGAEGAAQAPWQTQVRASGFSFLKWRSAHHVFLLLWVYFTKVKLILTFTCRFKPEDLPVQLSDELAGSLRQLKVLDKTCKTFLCSSLWPYPTSGTQSLSVMDFCVIPSLYCLEGACLIIIHFGKKNTEAIHWFPQGFSPFMIQLLMEGFRLPLISFYYGSCNASIVLMWCEWGGLILCGNWALNSRENIVYDGLLSHSHLL